MEKSLLQSLIEQLQNSSSTAAIVTNISASLIYDSAKIMGRELWKRTKDFFDNENEAEEFVKKIAVTEKTNASVLDEQLMAVLQQASSKAPKNTDEFIGSIREWLQNDCSKLHFVNNTVRGNNISINQSAARDFYNVNGTMIINNRDNKDD